MFLPSAAISHLLQVAIEAKEIVVLVALPTEEVKDLAKIAEVFAEATTVEEAKELQTEVVLLAEATSVPTVVETGVETSVQTAVEIVVETLAGIVVVSVEIPVAVTEEDLDVRVCYPEFEHYRKYRT
jgi:hypothetical protein